MANDDSDLEKYEDVLELAERLRVALGTFVRAVRSQAETPTTSQSEALSLLERSGAMSVAQLADLRNVRHQSMRLVVGQLEGEGLIARLPNPADGRSQLLSLTERGREVLSRSRHARASKIAAMIEEKLAGRDLETLRAAIAVIERMT